MKLRVSRSLAFSSCLLAAILATGATRPRYGGTLRIQLLAPVSRLDGPEGERVVALTAETLVDLDDQGNPRPRLAAEWQHDSNAKHWRFRLRPHVSFHDGNPLTAADAVDSLSPSVRLIYPEATVTAPNVETVAIESPRGLPALAAELSMPRHAIFKRPADNQLLGTGPFRIAEYQQGVKLSLVANEDYWGGRPYLDAIEMTGSGRGAADLIELPANVASRQMPERTRLWTSAALHLIAISMPEAPDPVREAIAQSVDRSPIVSVLTQRRGEAAGSLLPEWLSGYAFVFPTQPDLPRARHAASQYHGEVVGIAYPPQDGLARLIAERVVLNAHDAGLNARISPLGDAANRVIRIPINTSSPALALADLARQFGLLSERVDGAALPQTLLDAEMSMLQDAHLVPVVFVPELFAIGPRVRDWDATQSTRSRVWHLESVWLAQ